MMETSQWSFYYCYKCRGWYRKHYRIRYLEEPIRDKKMIQSLNWFCTSEMQINEANLEISESIRKYWYRFKDLFSF